MCFPAIYTARPVDDTRVALTWNPRFVAGLKGLPLPRYASFRWTALPATREAIHGDCPCWELGAFATPQFGQGLQNLIDFALTKVK